MLSLSCDSIITANNHSAVTLGHFPSKSTFVQITGIPRNGFVGFGACILV